MSRTYRVSRESFTKTTRIARETLSCPAGRQCSYCRSSRTFGSIKRERIAIEALAGY